MPEPLRKATLATTSAETVHHQWSRAADSSECWILAWSPRGACENILRVEASTKSKSASVPKLGSKAARAVKLPGAAFAKSPATS